MQQEQKMQEPFCLAEKEQRRRGRTPPPLACSHSLPSTDKIPFIYSVFVEGYKKIIKTTVKLYLKPHAATINFDKYEFSLWIPEDF